MEWDDWKELGKKIVGLGAPILIGGYADPALGALVGALFGADPGDPKALESAILADPRRRSNFRNFSSNI